MKNVKNKIFKELYKVDKMGRVFSVRRNKFLKPRIGSGKYPEVVLCKNTYRKHYLVHRLVAEAFLPNPKKYQEINHINGIKTDNRLENLEWSTRSENVKHSYTKKLREKRLGSEVNTAVLKEKDIPIIRQMIKNGIYLKDIANEYKVHEATISAIKNKKTWRHIK